MNKTLLIILFAVASFTFSGCTEVVERPTTHTSTTTETTESTHVHAPVGSASQTTVVHSGY